MKPLTKGWGFVLGGLFLAVLAGQRIKIIQARDERSSLLRLDQDYQKELRQLRQEQARRIALLSVLEKQKTPLGEDDTAPDLGNGAENTIGLWLARVRKLRQRLEEHPEQKIPELRWLSDQDWLNVSRSELNSEDDYRRALAKLRANATNKYSFVAAAAVKKFAAANDGAFPTDLSQLQPFFENPDDAAILGRYAIIPKVQLPYVKMPGELLITESSQVDEQYDVYDIIGPMESGASFSSGAAANSYLNVLNRYRSANEGRTPTDPSQLVPYATSPQQKSVVEQAVQRTIEPSISFDN